MWQTTNYMKLFKTDKIETNERKEKLFLALSLNLWQILYKTILYWLQLTTVMVECYGHRPLPNGPGFDSPLRFLLIRRGRIMRRTLIHTNWKHLGSFHCCCHFVFLFRSYIQYRERLDLTAVLCLVHLKVLWFFLISPINLF